MSRQHNCKLFRIIAFVSIILVGCGPKVQEPMPICPGKQSLAESARSLNAHSKNIMPFKANGQCLAMFYNQDKKKHEKENFPVKIWVKPPAHIRLHGDVAFNARGIDAGSNKYEFWLAMKPKEISTYWWGKWSEQEGFSEKLIIDPKLVLEALGIVEIADQEDWTLLNEGAFDIITKRASQGKITQKIYINCCDYQIRKIEYFQQKDKAVVITMLDEYKKVSEDFFVPTVIKIIHCNPDDTEDSLKITLKSVKPKSFTEKQQNIFFTRPPAKGFEDIYKIIDGKMVKQNQ